MLKSTCVCSHACLPLRIHQFSLVCVHDSVSHQDEQAVVVCCKIKVCDAL